MHSATGPGDTEKERAAMGMDWRANKHMISTGPNYLYLWADLFSDDNRHFQKERVYTYTKIKLIKCPQASNDFIPGSIHRNPGLKSSGCLTAWFPLHLYIVRAWPHND